MSIKIQQIEVQGNNTKYSVNYNNQQNYAERYFDRDDQYALMQKQAENLVTYLTNTTWDFYFDVPGTKTRFIGLDTGENGSFEKYSELATCLNSTPAGYHIVIFAHWLYHDNAKSEACTNIESIIDAYNIQGSVTINTVPLSFSGAQGHINLLLGGHIHSDLSWTTTGGVPVVLCDSDNGPRTNNTTYSYVAGTITEQAFDVITIDYTAGSVKAVRIGRGADRQWPA